MQISFAPCHNFQFFLPLSTENLNSSSIIMGLVNPFDETSSASEEGRDDSLWASAEIISKQGEIHTAQRELLTEL